MSRRSAKNKKYIFYAALIIVGLSVGVLIPLSSFGQGQFIWNVNVGTYGASVNNHYFDITSVSDFTYTPPAGQEPPTTPGSPPPTVSNPPPPADPLPDTYIPPTSWSAPTYYSSYTIQGWQSMIDFGTIVIEPTAGNGGAYGTGSWNQHGTTGMRFTISAVIPITANGNPTPDGNPVVAYSYTDTTVNPNIVWKQYYFSYEVMIATLSRDGNDASADALVFAGCNLVNGWRNSSYQTKFGGAQVVAVDTGATIEDRNKYLEGTSMPTASDAAPKIQPYQTSGSQIGPQQVITTGSSDIGNTWYIMQLGGYLTPGIGYNAGYPFTSGITFHVDVYIKYTVHFSVIASEPPVVNEGNIGTLDNYADKAGYAGNNFFTELFGNIMFWVLIAGVGVFVLIALFLVVKIRTGGRRGR